MAHLSFFLNDAPKRLNGDAPRNVFLSFLNPYILTFKIN